MIRDIFVECRPFEYEVSIYRTTEEHIKDRSMLETVVINGNEQSINGNIFRFASTVPLTPQEVFDKIKGTRHIISVKGQFKLE